MVAIYIALGLLFLFSDIGTESFPAYRKEVGCVMIVYAAIRIVLSRQKFKREEES